MSAQFVRLNQIVQRVAPSAGQSPGTLFAVFRPNSFLLNYPIKEIRTGGCAPVGGDAITALRKAHRIMLTQILGWFASGLVFATFCARKMLLLRLLAIISNFAFIAYGYEGRLWPIVALHLAMLPVNLVRLSQLIFVSSPA